MFVLRECFYTSFVWFFSGSENSPRGFSTYDLKFVEISTEFVDERDYV